MDYLYKKGRKDKHTFIYTNKLVQIITFGQAVFKTKRTTLYVSFNGRLKLKNRILHPPKTFILTLQHCCNCNTQQLRAGLQISFTHCLS